MSLYHKWARLIQLFLNTKNKIKSNMSNIDIKFDNTTDSDTNNNPNNTIENQVINQSTDKKSNIKMKLNLMFLHG